LAKRHIKNQDKEKKNIFHIKFIKVIPIKNYFIE